MHKFISAIALSVIGTIVIGASAQAQSNSISLSAVASRNSYTLHWLYPERSIQLYRPGLVIVIRPGERAYDVNNRVEFSDAAPTYVNGDMLISTALATRLRRLASMTATRAAAFGARSVAEQMEPASGPITVDARHAQGSEALRITGHAPAGLPVTITLLATISPDLPTVVVSRHDVQPDANGQFQAIISNAPDYLRGSLLQVVATSAGASPASATVTVGPPNPGVTVPFDKPYCPNTDPFCAQL
jgi:hypothetical protein